MGKEGNKHVYCTECWLRLLYNQSGANKSPCLNDGNLSRGDGCKRFYLKTGPELGENWIWRRPKERVCVFRVIPKFHLEQQDGWMDGTAIHWDKGKDRSLLFVHLNPAWPGDLGLPFKINSIIMPGIVCLLQVLKDWFFGALSCPECLRFFG